MNADIDLGQAIGFSGKYWVVVHDGKGNILRSSSPGKNKLTVKLFNDLMSGVNLPSGTPVVGTGNASPTETDNTLAVYTGKCNTVEVVAGSYSYSDMPDSNGFVYQRQTYVAHYLPGRLGPTGTVNLAEAGIAAAVISSTTGTTPLYSRGLLVNSSNVPVTVPYDVANEYLDVYWELTWWVKAETSGTVSFDILGVPTDHDYVVRISNWRKQESTATGNWDMPPTDSNGIILNNLTFRPVPGSIYNNPTSTYACSGPLGPITGFPVRASGQFYGSSAPIQPFLQNKQRDWLLKFPPANGNVPDGIGAFHIGSYAGGDSLRGPTFQVGISPKLVKTAQRSWELGVRCSMGNYE